MSTGVCGKRVGYDDYFGSSSSPTNKRSKWSSNFESSEIGSGSDDPVSSLIQMFPTIDPEFVRKVLISKNNVFEEAKESLSSISFNGDSNRTEEVNTFDASSSSSDTIDGAKWVDTLISEMANSINIDDMRQRVATILEALERHIKAQNISNASKKIEYDSLKENLQSLIHDNQILKRVVANQHQRSFENEEKVKEVSRLRNVLGQYQEQVHKLELSNYAMKLHLQQSQQQQQSSFSGNLPPDVY